VELYNPNNYDVDISYWWLTDNWVVILSCNIFFKDLLIFIKNPRNYIFPPGTVLSPSSYTVFYSKTQIPFSFSSAGEAVWLIGASFNETLTGYYHGFVFYTTPFDTIYARYFDCNNFDYFTKASSATPSQPNSPVYPSLGSILLWKYILIF